MTRSICDLADDHPQLARIAEPLFHDYGALRQFGGRIATLRCFEDNVLLRSVLSTPGDGRVMVVDGGGSIRRALVGDKLAALMLKNHWAGIVVNGAARDIEHLNRMQVAVRALNICPAKPAQLGSGEQNIELQFAGVTFRPNEWLYADENGLIVSAEPLS